MGKRVGEIEDDLILLAGLVIGGYFLVTKIFPPGATQAQTNTVSAEFTSSDAANPFKYDFQYGLYAQDPNTYNAAWWQNLSQQSAQMLQNGQNPADVSGVYNYITWAEQIRSAFGLFSVNFQVIQSVFQALSGQNDVSNIAAYLYFMRGIDLYQLLLNGTGSSLSLFGGLGTANMATLINEVNALPGHS